MNSGPSKAVSNRCGKASRVHWTGSPIIWRSSEFSLEVAIRCSIHFGPALTYGRYELLLALSHLPDKRLIAGIFVPGCPEHHFREDRCEIDTLRGERVILFSPVRWVTFRGDDSMSYQLAKPIGQNIRRDSFVGFQEFLVRPESPQHHVANNQQRPAIPQNLHGSIQRTPRPPLWTGLLLRHIPTVAFFTCISQVT